MPNLFSSSFMESSLASPNVWPNSRCVPVDRPCSLRTFISSKWSCTAYPIISFSLGTSERFTLDWPAAACVCPSAALITIGMITGCYCWADAVASMAAATAVCDGFFVDVVIREVVRSRPIRLASCT